MSIVIKYQIYCDMDGVLVDFEGGAVRAINTSLRKPVPDSPKLRKLIMKIAAMSPPGNTVIKLDDLRYPGEGLPLTEKMKIIRKYMYTLLKGNYQYWVDLEATSDGMELWNYISQYNPYILTAPMGQESADGKDVWIKENLNPQPEKVFMSHDKFKWATDKKGRPNILIDDFKKNTIPWEENGGIAILHTSAAETIKRLKELEK